jgi:hypothetical protein
MIYVIVAVLAFVAGYYVGGHPEQIKARLAALFAKTPKGP